MNLGCHVRRRPAHRLQALLAFENVCQPKVGKLDAISVALFQQQQVLWFDVPMDDALLVQIPQRLDAMVDDGRGIVLRVISDVFELF